MNPIVQQNGTKVSDCTTSGWDVVIIGAGLAGLTAAAYLGRAGLKVLVLEKAPLPGGRAATKQVDGAQLNLGPHALYPQAAGILREVGVEPKGKPANLNGSFVFGTEDKDYRVVPFLGLLTGRVLRWGEVTELFRLLLRTRKINTDRLQGVTLQQYLQETVRSPQVRKITEAFVRLSTYCHAPGLLSAGAALQQLQNSRVLYVDEGWGCLVQALRAQTERLAVPIRLGTAVREIHGRFPNMSIVLKDGEQIRTRTVLSTAGPRETLAMLTPDPLWKEPEIPTGIPVRAACLDLVLNGLPNPNVQFCVGVDRPWYFSNHSASAKLTDDPRDAVVHVMKYLTPFEETEPMCDEAELEAFLNLIQPGWRDRVRYRRFLPKLLVSHTTVTARDGGLAGCPGPAIEGRPGLYAAGDWVGGEGLLLNASLTSAKAASECIMEQIGIEAGGPNGSRGALQKL